MMPQAKIVFFQAEDRTVPALDWLRDMKRRDPRITAKFHERLVQLVQLAEQGWQMMRPASDTLRDGIHEIRVRHGSVNYRLLYGFHEVEGQQTIAVLVHSLTKERADPQKHTYVRPPQPRR